MKKIIACLVASLSVCLLFSEQKQSYKITNLQVQGQEIKTSRLDSYPLTVNCSKTAVNENTGIILTGNLTLPENWNDNVGIILYKNLMACKVYVNDHLIDTIGKSGKNFFFQPYISRGVLVPAGLLKKENTVRLELWNDTGSYKIRMIRVTDAVTYENSMGLYNFLDIQLPRFACVLLFFVALYSLFMFINYKEKREFLHLGLSAFFFAIYLLNVTVYNANMPYVLLKAFLYSCFPASIIFLIRFFRRFFILRTPKKVLNGLNILGIFFIAGYYVQRNTATLDTWHSIMLLYPCIGLCYGTVGFFKSLRETGLRNIGIGIGLLVAILFSVYDMYNFVFDIMPFVLLQGLGFMGLIIGTFYSLSQEVADTNSKCVRFAEELEENRDKQDAIIEHVKGASEKADSAGKMLDSSIASVSTLVSQYLASIDQVNSNIQVQHEQVQSNKENVTQIFTAIDKMSGMVEQHEKLVDLTVTDVSNLTDGIHKTDILVKKSSDTIRILTEVCTAADKDVANSSRLVDDLANYSKNIYKIVNSISELSEQTNVLSINAAIEAARSGVTGKGFSVVAGEIRSLATQSGENAKKINDILSTMISKIGNIQSQESLVSSRLKDVISENTKTEEGIEEIFGVLKTQLEQSSRISSIIGDLMKTVRNIAGQTSAQKTSGEELNHSLELLSTITDAVLVASREQQTCNEELKNNLNKIRSASEGNVEVITELNAMLA